MTEEGIKTRALEIAKEYLEMIEETSEHYDTKEHCIASHIVILTEFEKVGPILLTQAISTLLGLLKDQEDQESEIKLKTQDYFPILTSQDDVIDYGNTFPDSRAAYVMGVMVQYNHLANKFKDYKIIKR